MIGYIQLGVDIKYLLAAAFMTAPAGLLFSKIMYPEVKRKSVIKKFLMQLKQKKQAVFLMLLQLAHSMVFIKRLLWVHR